MKKIFRILLLFIIILLIVLLILYLKCNTNLSSQLSKTKSIIIIKYIWDEKQNNFQNEKKITNSNDIEKIIKIIDNKTKMLDEENIPYGVLPQYRLKMLDENNSVIIEIDLFLYKYDISWISFKNNDTKYIIDTESLMKIIDY